MSALAEKMKSARRKLRYTQADLALRVGVSDRSIKAYERDEKYPRKKTMMKLAEALGVSTKYLVEDDCNNPYDDIENDSYFITSRGKVVVKEFDEFDRIMTEATALLAGGKYDEEQKDQLFFAVMEAYKVGKEKARIKKLEEEEQKFLEENNIAD